MISIKLYLRITQILIIVYPKFPENFLFFVEFPETLFKISSHLNISNQLIKVFKNLLKNLEIFLKIFVTVL